MTTVALLRGINVGGHRKLPMADLKSALLAAGASAPETYIQSGNAVFEGEASQVSILNEIIKLVGFRPTLMLIDGADFLQIARANPFPDAVTDPKSLHIFFLAEPTPTPLDELLSNAGPEESLHLSDQALYLHTPKYLSGSKVAPKAEKLLKVAATARNWNTVDKLAQMVEARA